MTFYEMTQPAAQKTGFFDGLFSKLSAGIKVVQYSRMVQALSGLSDDQLAEIGLTRKDIPAHAQKCVYAE